MMKSSRREKDKTIQHSQRCKKSFQTKKETDNTTIKDIRKPVRLGIFWSNNYIKHESNDDRNKIEEYLNKIRPYLKDINNLKISDGYMQNSINNSN